MRGVSARSVLSSKMMILLHTDTLQNTKTIRVSSTTPRSHEYLMSMGWALARNLCISLMITNTPSVSCVRLDVDVMGGSMGKDVRVWGTAA